MDGQYHSLAFICTKTDGVSVSETLRALKNTDQQLLQKCSKIEDKGDVYRVRIHEHKEKLRTLEDSYYDMEHQLNSIEDRKSVLFDLLDAKSNSDDDSSNIEKGTDDMDIEIEDENLTKDQINAELEQEEHKMKELQEKIKTCEESIDQLKTNIYSDEKILNDLQKKIASICAKARNAYSKKQIVKDFNAGLREMKKKAKGETGEEEEEDYIDLEAEDPTEQNNDGDKMVEENDDEDTISLPVFTVSAIEYLKLSGKLIRDGPPQTFDDIEDTEIPKLRKFVHTLTEQTRRDSAKTLIKALVSFVRKIFIFVSDDGTMDTETRESVKKIFNDNIGMLSDKMTQQTKEFSGLIDSIFASKIGPKVQMGVGAARNASSATVTKWGMKVNREDKTKGGYYWSTYKASCRCDGEYNSRSMGEINMNQDLAEPLYTTMSVSWERAFTTDIPNGLRGVIQNGFRKILQEFYENNIECLSGLGINRGRLDLIGKQQQKQLEDKLKIITKEIEEKIIELQRDVNRVITPQIRQHMKPAYKACVEESGTGSFMRMKAHMSSHVDSHLSMFDDSANFFLNALNNLKKQVEHKVSGSIVQIKEDLKQLYEPFWEAPIDNLQLKKTVLPVIKLICETVDNIRTVAGVVGTTTAPVIMKSPVKPPVQRISQTTTATPTPTTITKSPVNPPVQRISQTTTATPTPTTTCTTPQSRPVLPTVSLPVRQLAEVLLHFFKKSQKSAKSSDIRRVLVWKKTTPEVQKLAQSTPQEQFGNVVKSASELLVRLGYSIFKRNSKKRYDIIWNDQAPSTKPKPLIPHQPQPTSNTTTTTRQMMPQQTPQQSSTQSTTQNFVTTASPQHHYQQASTRILYSTANLNQQQQQMLRQQYLTQQQQLLQQQQQQQQVQQSTVQIFHSKSTTATAWG